MSDTLPTPDTSDTPIPTPVQVGIGYNLLVAKITKLEDSIKILTQSNKEKDNKIELLKMAKTQVQTALETIKKMVNTKTPVETKEIAIQTNENKMLKIVKLSQKNIPTFETRTRDIVVPEPVPEVPVPNEFEEKYKELKKINYDTLRIYETLRTECDTYKKNIQDLETTIKELKDTLGNTNTDLLKYRGENAILRRQNDSNISYPRVVSGRYAGVSRR
jgi:prefoldin subunit 5